MPHLIVEYSANVAEYHDIGALLDVIQEVVLNLDVAPVAGVRIRAIRQDEYRIGDSSDPNFAYIAMVARLGPGRDDDTKAHLITTILDTAEAHIAAEDGPLAIAWSLEVQEIDAAYRVNRNAVKRALEER